MIKVWVLIVLSIYQSDGLGFTHTFYDKAACEQAVQKIVDTDYALPPRKAFCQESQVPKLLEDK